MTTMMMIMTTTTLYLPIFQKNGVVFLFCSILSSRTLIFFGARIIILLLFPLSLSRERNCLHTYGGSLVKSSWLYIYYTHVHAREHYTCTVHNNNVINIHSYCTITPFYTIIRITWSTFSLYMYMCLFRSTIINLNRCSTIFHSQKLYINGLIDPR